MKIRNKSLILAIAMLVAIITITTTITTTATEQTYQITQAVYAQEEDDSKTFTDEECEQDNSSSGFRFESSGECTTSIGREEEPLTCVECFREILSSEEIRRYLSVIDFENVDQACMPTLISAISIFDLIEAGIDDTKIARLLDCLEKAGRAVIRE